MKYRTFIKGMSQPNLSIDVTYYEGKGHNAIFNDSAQFNDTVNHIADFVRDQIVNQKRSSIKANKH